MVEYQTAIDNLVRVIRQALEAEVNRQTLSHRTRARSLADMSGMESKAHNHKAMVEIYRKAGRNIWDVFQVEIKELRDNG